MKLILFQFVLMLLLSTGSVVADTRVTTNIDFDWKCHGGDLEGAQQNSFNDAPWADVDLPHDWSVEGEYAADNPAGGRCGYLPTGVVWYRKTFDSPLTTDDKQMFVEFDSVFMNSTVWINGHQLGKRPYGYIRFAYDLTEHLKPKDNVLAVRVDNTLQPSGRWYTGTGIFGHVNLLQLGSVHIKRGGVFFKTVEADQNNASGEVTVEIEGPSAEGLSLLVENELVGDDGTVVAKTEPQAIEVGQQCLQKWTLKNPKRWGVERPHLYTLRTIIRNGNRVIDQLETRVGIRTLKFSLENGFQLNGQSLKLKGVCEHHDGGPVGGAFPRKILRERIMLLKRMGCNAIRTAHNPRTADFYELCDELGMLVMDEIFDGWHQKAEEDYGGRFFDHWWKQDVESWIRANRNYPCIVMYSVGNETGENDVHDITGYIKRFDTTRPTTGGTMFEGVDIQGYNGPGGEPGSMQEFHEKFPDEICVRTEVPHTLQTRGFYRVKTWWRDKRKPRNLIPEYGDKQIFFDGHPRYSSCYDNCGVRISARTSWRETRDMPWIIGEFRWTGFDYIGEASFGGGEWPARIWNFGIIDLAGIPKDHFWFYQSQWTQEPMVHILPHWTHRFLEPDTIVPVVAYSNCDSVELFLNGQSLGKKQEDPQWLEFLWKVPYQQGTLKAVGYNDGKAVAEKVWQTSQQPAKLRLETNNRSLDTDRRDTATITVSATDRNGVTVPWAMNRVEFKIEGPVKNLGFENGDPVDVTRHRINHRNLFYGYARGFLQATDGTGDVRVTAAAILGDTVFPSDQMIALDVQSVQLRGGVDQVSHSDVEMRYTIDGSDPENGKLYTEPFQISQTTRVRAVVLRDAEPLLTLTEEFVKGTREPVSDRRWAPDADKSPAAAAKGPKRFPGPFDKELIGKWVSDDNVLFEFRADGVMVENSNLVKKSGRKSNAGGKNKSKSKPKPTRGFWWYDFPDDVFENPKDAGNGQIRWKKAGDGELQLETQAAEVLKVIKGDKTLLLRRKK